MASAFADRTRMYQQEMFERSMEGNKIIVMDTGSGKTQVYFEPLQQQSETDWAGRCFEFMQSSMDTVWFLAPSVELCIQQHQVLEEAIPAYKMRLLTGRDNVDKWSDKKTWDVALDQVRVVVATHAILLDALRHAFVKLAAIALLVFDEAHHCIKKHPANLIMQEFYYPLKRQNEQVPHILGLSASVIMSSTLGSMPIIEANLDSVSVTPHIHRKDLRRHVYRPECSIVRYNTSAIDGATTSAGLAALQRLFISVTADSGPATQEEQSYSECSYTSDRQGIRHTLEKLLRKSVHIMEELGPCSADYYIRETISFLRSKSVLAPNLEMDIEANTQRSLLSMLECSAVENACRAGGESFSTTTDKVRCLIDYLLSAADISGIVFVTQRVVASVLSVLLSRHPRTRDRLKCAPMVGTSSYSARKVGITDLIDISVQKQALDKFRQGQSNVIVATSVLEEGIDVQSCNIVACFDPPANLKSFIQRRGRARHQQSQLCLLLSTTADVGIVSKWKALEAELTAICQREREVAEVAFKMEAQDEHLPYVLQVTSTGAKLDADSTLAHLNHFCKSLRSASDSVRRPSFAYQLDEDGKSTCAVTLPPSVPASVRVATSKQAWRSEGSARRDAAFQAYTALYDAGLLNDNLLPLSQEWDVNEGLEMAAPPTRVRLADSSLWTPYGASQQWYRTEVTLRPITLSDQSVISIRFYSSVHVQDHGPLLLCWDRSTSYEVHFDRSSPTQLTNAALHSLEQFTLALYRAPRSSRLWDVNGDVLTLFESPAASLVDEEPASRYFGQQAPGLVRAPGRTPLQFVAWTENNGRPSVTCIRLPRRRDFVSPFRSETQEAEDSTAHGASSMADEDEDGIQVEPVDHQQNTVETFDVEDCTVGHVPMSLARASLFMPAILQHISDHKQATSVLETLFKSIARPPRDYILSALSAPSALRSSNYQRLEFLGDCVLKYVTSRYLFATYPAWPEGFLTIRRSVLISNATLASAAIRTNLGQHIISEPIDYRHWTLPTALHVSKPKTVPMKLLADVVEALIGAFWLGSDINAALQCVHIFLPSVNPIEASLESLDTSNTITFSKQEQIEALIGYQFTHPSLLRQALLHPSHAQFTNKDSYERLEFLGDAVLDMLVITLLAEHIDKLDQGRMTLIKAALVNADLLGYLCFHLRLHEQHRCLDTMTLAESTEVYEVSLADCVSFHSANIAANHRQCNEQYFTLRDDIQQQLASSHCHPWDKLNRLGAGKMYSDVVESILGAILVDCGTLTPCNGFISRLGLKQYAARVIREQVDVQKPISSN